MNFRNILKHKGFYVSAFVLLAVTATGLFLMTDSSVSAQKGDRASRGENSKGEVARADMLAFALNMRSANDQTVFGQKGVRGDSATVSGKVSAGSDANLAGGLSGVKVRSDLTKSFSAINQLPCIDLESELTGGSFNPGVYCAPSADLTGNMTLGGEGIYVFRVDGSLKTAETFSMTMNGAKSGSVYFVAGDTASIAAYSTIEGTFIARNSVNVGAGTTVKGRALSLNGEVILGAASNLVLQTGVIEICKEALTAEDVATPATFDTLGNRIFGFLVNGIVYTTPVGSCTGPITIAENTPTTIEELNTGTYTDRAGTWINRFRLVSVTATGPGSIVPGTTNLPARTVQVTVPHSTISNQTVVTFTNTFAIPAVIEICKHAAAGDPDVTGFFDFTVDAIPNTIFPVPVGGCSGALQVLVPTSPGAPPGQGIIRVTEIGRPGFTLESGSTFPEDAGVPTATVVTPANLAPGGRWYPADTRAPGVGTFELGPGTPPLGQGSFGLDTPDAAAKVQLFTDLYDGVRLADIDGIGYSSFKDPVSVDGPATTSLNLRVDLTGDGVPDAYMVFEPYQDQGNAAIVEGVWQNWDAYRGGAALWWLNTGAPTCTQATPCTWAAIVALFPNATIEEGANCGPGGVTVPCPGSLGFNQGSGNPGTFTNADALYVTVNGNTTTFDFEVTGVSTTFLDLNRGIRNTTECSLFPAGTAVPAGCYFDNPGGGIITAIVEEGGTSNQTTLNFFNRTNPGVVKICKVAGPGIPVGTRFQFEVRGTAPSNPFPGAIMPGVDVVRQVTVVAGPAMVAGGAAEQGGFCNFVRETNGALTRFIIGSNVLVRELGWLDPIPGVPPGEVRISRIRVNQSTSGVFVAAPVTVGGITTNPNPDLTPNADLVATTTINEADLGRVVFQARAATREAEFTNFVFRPTLLKICKIGDPTLVNAGTQFTFTTTILNPGGLFGNQTNQPITVPNTLVQAGAPTAGGFCQFVQGPFTPTATTPPIGTFPVGATVRVCEPTASNAGTTLQGVTSPTGVPTVDLPGRCADLTLGHADGFNEIIFSNAAGSPLESGSTFALSGRVLTPEGGGLRNAQVVLIGADGVRRTVPTSSMGYYSFEGLANETYRVSVTSRRYRFTERNVELNSSLADVNFVGIE